MNYDALVLTIARAVLMTSTIEEEVKWMCVKGGADDCLSDAAHTALEDHLDDNDDNWGSKIRGDVMAAIDNLVFILDEDIRTELENDS